MPEEDLQAQLARLQELPADAQTRVADALKTSIEAEITAVEAGPDVNPSAAFSRGILFSKSSAAVRNPDEVVLPAITQMDDPTYEAFAQRLADLKNLTGRGGNQ